MKLQDIGESWLGAPKFSDGVTKAMQAQEYKLVDGPSKVNQIDKMHLTHDEHSKDEVLQATFTRSSHAGGPLKGLLASVTIRQVTAYEIPKGANLYFGRGTKVVTYRLRISNLRYNERKFTEAEIIAEIESKLNFNDPKKQMQLEEAQRVYGYEPYDGAPPPPLVMIKSAHGTRSIQEGKAE